MLYRYNIDCDTPREDRIRILSGLFARGYICCAEIRITNVPRLVNDFPGILSDGFGVQLFFGFADCRKIFDFVTYADDLNDDFLTHLRKNDNTDILQARVSEFKVVTLEEVLQMDI